MSVRVEEYNPHYKQDWNTFVSISKNGYFLFNRGYMDYHADRFKDNSLLFYNNDELLALLPASRHGNELRSHGGLTFGGMLLHSRASAKFVIEAFEALSVYAKSNGFNNLIYKSIPFIYHKLPACEDAYALFLSGAALYRRDVSSVIDLTHRLTFTKGTKSNLSKARKAGVRIEGSKNFYAFMQIEEKLLAAKYGTTPTHTAAELSMLAESFPENIKLYFAFCGTDCLGGTVVYDSGNTLHTQYIGISDEGKEVGALDAVVDYLLNEYATSRRWFSFGISTEKNGEYLNEGLIRNKESFGARAIVHDFYNLTWK